MVLIYVNLIVVGRKTFDEVPAKLQDAVREELFAMGLDQNGKPLAA